jgi:hypothetical protein
MDDALKQADGRAAAERAVQRFRAAPTEFVSARQLKLPALKEAFPKLVTMDMPHWIAMTRVHYGRSTDDAARAALASLRASVADGRVIVAATDVNVREASGSEDVERRKRLAAFMVVLAQNYCLVPHQPAVLELEGLNSLRRTMGDGQAHVEVRPALLLWGFGHAFGRRPFESDDANAPIADALLDYPEVSEHRIVHGIERSQLRALYSSEQAISLRTFRGTGWCP